jgi:hypothetical protein
MNYAYEDDITIILIQDYALPVMSKEMFIEMSKRVVNVYALDPYITKVETIAAKMVEFLTTDFGNRAFKQILIKFM